MHVLNWHNLYKYSLISIIGKIDTTAFNQGLNISTLKLKKNTFFQMEKINKDEILG